MEIKVGEYVRTKEGIIAKVVEIDTKFIWCDDEIDCYNSNLIPLSTDRKWEDTYKNLVIKHSKRIIDLIEVGDYVNGQQITKVTYDPFVDSQTDLWTDRTIPFEQDFQQERFLNEDIKTILTHEQFEQNAYRLEEK